MKTRVGVIFGGMSVEHEVSVISALQAIHSMDKDRFEAIPIYISKNRNWYTGESLLDIDEYKNIDSLLKKVQKVQLTRTDGNSVVLMKDPQPKFGKKFVEEVDVVFPVMHGTYGEDGILQGFLELLDIPYVGCDVLSSANGMDKVTMKNIFRDSGLPVLDFVWFYSVKWHQNKEKVASKIEEKLGYPVIVKPANLGSSVGISKAANAEELDDAIDLALQFANKIVVEKMVEDLTEVNCSVLGDFEEAEASILEQVLGTDEILSYQDKYQGSNSAKGAKGMESASRIIPAEISEDQTKEVQEIAKEAFHILGCSGVSRIDFIIDNSTNKVYINEINTIPGSLSFYLWEPTGKSFTQLTTDLINLALRRVRQRERLMYSIDSNLFQLQSGSGIKGGSKGSKQ